MSRYPTRKAIGATGRSDSSSVVGVMGRENVIKKVSELVIIRLVFIHEIIVAHVHKFIHTRLSVFFKLAVLAAAVTDV